MFEFVEDGMEFAAGIGHETVQFVSNDGPTMAKTRKSFFDKYKKDATGCRPHRLVKSLQDEFNVKLYADIYDKNKCITK